MDLFMIHTSSTGPVHFHKIQKRCSHVLSFIGYIILAKDTMDRQNGTWWWMRHLIRCYPTTLVYRLFCTFYHRVLLTVATVITKRETREPLENHVLIHHIMGSHLTAIYVKTRNRHLIGSDPTAYRLSAASGGAVTQHPSWRSFGGPTNMLGANTSAGSL